MQQIEFHNTYADLPDRFFARLSPTPVSRPALVRINAPLAVSLGLDPDWLASADGVNMLAGNALPETADPLAMAYAGHQFGGWSPQLGDGRAILLGEVAGFDLQLKGSGRTPWSRGGDGRAWLGPVMREYIVSEAMAAFGVPTTRALAAVTTGDIVLREAALPGAVLTRVASSHVRVGTFQYFAARADIEALQVLTDYVIDRHYPDARGAERPALALLTNVVDAQASLIARWMGLGFIHGVMNTDNMTISGETIDYGPCAFMDGYHPDTVFSSIDSFGRYAYHAQPQVGQWNLAQFASCLLPLIDDVKDEAVRLATEAIDAYPALYEAHWLQVFARKLAISDPSADDLPLATALLTAMAEQKADFTQTFRALGEVADDVPIAGVPQDWRNAWLDRLGTLEVKERQNLLRAANPAIIPRNHRVEEAIAAGVEGDYSVFHALTEALQTPFDAPEGHPFRDAPEPDEVVQQTFCGT